MQALKRGAATAAIAAVLVVFASVASIGPAAAHASCGTTVSDKDSSSWNAAGGGANMRSGSSTTCAINGLANSGQRLDYHCFTVGNDGASWTYTRNDSTGVSGWIRDDLLSDFGSDVPC